MITGNQICLKILAAGTYYVQVPIACQISTVRATCQNGSIGASTVIIKSSDAVTIGTATWTTTLGVAGGKAAYVPSIVTPLSTTANLDLAKDAVIQVVVALNATAAGIVVQIELDPYAVS